MRYAPDADPRSESVIDVAHRARDTVLLIVERVGIPLAELGANVFVNGRYADLATPVEDGARIGLFPDDMQLLYKWYFRPAKDSREQDLLGGGPRVEFGATRRSPTPVAVACQEIRKT
jgi:hypothetical protein